MQSPTLEGSKAIDLSIRRPAVTGISWWQLARSRLRKHIGAMLTKIGLPGAISETTIDDPVTRHHIEVHVADLYTRVTIDDRDYYFDRLTGEYGGGGIGCR